MSFYDPDIIINVSVYDNNNVVIGPPGPIGPQGPGIDGTIGPVDISSIWSGTQGQYDAISVKNPSTLYLIVG